MLNIRKKVIWVTRTAVLTALLVTVQFITAPLGNQFVTGAAVNLMLVISFLTCGFSTGLTVAIISPVCASLIGIGPAFPPLIPFIAVGNAVFILAWYLFSQMNKSEDTGIRHRIASYLIAAASAVIKSIALYAGIVIFAIPYILNLNEKQSAMLTLSFSYPQLINAIIGGIIALAAVPPLKKALSSRIQYQRPV